MATTGAILADIFIMFLAAKLAGELLERLRQPAVIGELLVRSRLGRSRSAGSGFVPRCRAAHREVH